MRRRNKAHFKYSSPFELALSKLPEASQIVDFLLEEGLMEEKDRSHASLLVYKKLKFLENELAHTQELLRDLIHEGDCSVSAYSTAVDVTKKKIAQIQELIQKYALKIE